MRTTLRIDDELLAAARSLAAERGVPVGKMVSELIRKGLRGSREPRLRPGDFPIFEVPENARPITLETVKKAEENS